MLAGSCLSKSTASDVNRTSHALCKNAHPNPETCACRHHMPVGRESRHRAVLSFPSKEVVPPLSPKKDQLGPLSTATHVPSPSFTARNSPPSPQETKQSSPDSGLAGDLCLIRRCGMVGIAGNQIRSPFVCLLSAKLVQNINKCQGHNFLCPPFSGKPKSANEGT